MHDHYATSVFCFCPNGAIPISFFNVPGSLHDSSQAADFGNIYSKLEGVYVLYGAKYCVDLAFGNMSRRYLHKSCQDYLGSDAPKRELRKLDLCNKRKATLARQTAEWGMRMFQMSFPQVKDRFVYEERGEQRIHLKMLVLLYNMCARMVGINQIRNIYMKHLAGNANEDVLY
jgi:hypothetical protein